MPENPYVQETYVVKMMQRSMTDQICDSLPRILSFLQAVSRVCVQLRGLLKAFRIRDVQRMVTFDGDI